MANPYEELYTAGSSSDNEDDVGSDTGREVGIPEDPWVGDDFTEGVLNPPEEDAWCQLTEDHCRATFETKQGGPTRVCGNIRAECNRRGHKPIKADRGDPGFYSALTPLGKNSPVDGNLEDYKSKESLEEELQGVEDRLRQEMENLATSQSYAEPPATYEPRLSRVEEGLHEDPAVQHIRTISDRMETTFDRATADALASPMPPDTPRVFGLAERVRQSLRSASRVGVGRISSDESQDGMSRARGAATTYMKTFRTVSAGLVAAPPHKFSPGRDRLAQRQAELDEQVEAFRAMKAAEQEKLDRLHQEEESLSQQRAAAAFGHAEKQRTAMKWTGIPSRGPMLPPVHQQRVSRPPGPMKSPPHEVAAQQELAALRAQVAAYEATFGRSLSQAASFGGPTMVTSQPLQEDAASMRAAKAANLKVASDQRGGSTYQPSMSGTRTYYGQTQLPDPKVTRLQAQYATLTARLTGHNHRNAGLPVPVPPVAASEDPYVEQMTQMVADLEEQLKVQEGAYHLHPQGTEEYLSPEARRIADLEAMVQRLSAKLDGMGKSGQAGVTAGNTARLLSESKNQGPAAATGHFSFDDIVPAKKDESVGDTIFGISIRMPQKVLETLCPKGMSDATRLQLSEAGLDVASLPGKYRSSSAMDIVDVHQEIANTMGHAMELVRDQQNSRARDLSYASERRNALSAIKNQEQLLSFKEELEETSDEALDSAENQMRNVLADLCLEPEVTEYFVTTSQFPTIIKKTLEFYKALVDHIVNLSSKYGFGHAQTDLDHYAHKLLIRRKGSHSRLEVLFKVYCDLRDGHRNKFIDPILQQKKNGQFLLKTLTSTQVQKVATPTPPKDGPVTPKGCRRCGSKLHPNTTSCPLFHVDVLPSVARKLANECQNAGDFMAAAKAALAKHLASKGGDGTPAGTPATPK